MPRAHALDGELAGAVGGPAHLKVGRVIAAGVLVAVGTGWFLLILASVSGEFGLARADWPILTWLVEHRTPVLTSVTTVIATVSGPVGMPIIVLVTTLVWALTSRRLWRPVLLASAMILGVLLTFLIAHLVGRPRPPEEFMLLGFDPTPSFPSGHAVGVGDFLLVGGHLICSRMWSVTRIVLCALTAVIGILLVDFSRLYLGYHWFTDVVAALGLSVAVLGLVIAVDAVRQSRGERYAQSRTKEFHW